MGPNNHSRTVRKTPFGPGADLLLRIAGLACCMVLGLLIWIGYGITFSSYGTGVGEAVHQPVPFSHAHHVGGLGIDCRYCHALAEKTSRAGMPTTDTCMHCHAQLWTDADLLAPVRESWRTGQPLHWQRVNKVPDYVYFDHSAHLAAGIGCSSCHGRVDQMPLMEQAEDLYMRWCIDCHRHPERAVRKKSQTYDMQWKPAPNQAERGAQLVAENGVRSIAEITNCTACHR